MSATIANDLFAVMEKQMGAEAARAAAAAYLANSQGSAAAPADKPKRVITEEQKAKMKAGREAALAKKAAEKAAGGAPVEPVAAPVKAAEPVAAPPAEAEKPKRVISDEQKAKMKAGREAALAKKAAEKAAGGAPAEPAEKAAEPSPQSDSSGPKKRGPKPLAEMTSEERAIHDAKVAERAAKKAMEKAAIQPPVTAQQADPTIFAEFTHKGVKYLRNMRGDLLTPEYEWVGRFDGKNINIQFPKPADLEDEEEETE